VTVALLIVIVSGVIMKLRKAKQAMESGNPNQGLESGKMHKLEGSSGDGARNNSYQHNNTGTGLDPTPPSPPTPHSHSNMCAAGPVYSGLGFFTMEV
jgi:hypothetical protein